MTITIAEDRNLMAEQVAVTRWCPFARESCGEGPTSFSANRSYDGDAMTGVCLGSGCMAWRWFQEGEKVRRGYCGLAGRP